MSQEPVVLLDRVVEGVLPEYCLHGQTECVRCRQWCHLGHQTERVVASGEALPLCMDCAHELRSSGQWPDAEPQGHIEDHRRADGPHPEDDPQEFVPCGNPTCTNTVAAPPPSSSRRVVVSACSPQCAEAIRDAHNTVKP